MTIAQQVVQTDPSGIFHAADSTAAVEARAPGYRAAVLVSEAFKQNGSVLRLTPFRPKALYLSFYGIGSAAIRGAALRVMHEAGLNALVIDIKGDRGLIAYRTGIRLAQKVGAQRVITIPDLPALLRSLHQQGLYLIARIVTFTVRMTRWAPHAPI